MNVVVEYLRQFPDLCTEHMRDFLKTCGEPDTKNVMGILDAWCKNEQVPTGIVAAVAYDYAEKSLQPALQRICIEIYLKMKCIEAMELERTPLISTEAMFESIRTCRVLDQCNDIAIAMARLLLIDDRWYVTLGANQVMVGWIQEHWVPLITSRSSQVRKRAIGNIADTLKDNLNDVRKQCRILSIEAVGHLDGRRFQQFEVSLGQVSKYMSSIFLLLTRRERRSAEQQLRLWAELRRKMRADTEKCRVVFGPDDARELSSEVKGNLSQSLGCSEFALLDMCIPIQVQLLKHIDGEMEGWGISVARIVVSCDRAIYPFIDNTDNILIKIQNIGAVSGNGNVVLHTNKMGVNLGLGAHVVGINKKFILDPPRPLKSFSP